MTFPERPPSTKWQRHVIDPIAAQLTQGITPEKISLTLAVGSALALFPIFGTTTLLCLAAGIILRLNQPIIQLVNALCATIHLPVIYCLFRLGYFIFGMPYTHVGIRMMNHMLWDDPREFFGRFGTDALHAIAAWAIIAPFWIVVTYMLALPVLCEVLRRRVLSVMACSPFATAAPPNPPPPSNHPVP
jgi:uncharacterized protein (DUF2062 family)